MVKEAKYGDVSLDEVSVYEGMLPTLLFRPTDGPDIRKGL